MTSKLYVRRDGEGEGEGEALDCGDIPGSEEVSSEDFEKRSCRSSRGAVTMRIRILTTVATHD